MSCLLPSHGRQEKEQTLFKMRRGIEFFSFFYTNADASRSNLLLQILSLEVPGCLELMSPWLEGTVIVFYVFGE